MWKSIKSAIKRMFCNESKREAVQQDHERDYSAMLRRFRLSSAMFRLDSNTNRPEKVEKPVIDESEVSHRYSWTWASWKRENAEQVELLRGL